MHVTFLPSQWHTRDVQLTRIENAAWVNVCVATKHLQKHMLPVNFATFSPPIRLRSAIDIGNLITESMKIPLPWLILQSNAFIVWSLCMFICPSLLIHQKRHTHTHSTNSMSLRIFSLRPYCLPAEQEMYIFVLCHSHRVSVCFSVCIETKYELNLLIFSIPFECHFAEWLCRRRWAKWKMYEKKKRLWKETVSLGVGENGK